MNENKKILLILDLDETLIHATKNKLDSRADLFYNDYLIYKRPYLNWFLETVNKDFELAVWSSAGDEYVTTVVTEICPENVYFQFIWGRSRCTTKLNRDLDKYIHEKRLKKVKKQGFELEKVLIIDDSPEKTRENYGNAIYIDPFTGNKDDNRLQKLASYLVSIKNTENVRIIEKRYWEDS
ncbi:phosphoprotein phosphatase [Leptobacterium flavescens]|uniref:Phosphoprotein phosphatase n=1 Tax=Leptobacterium flavescens TaxID=472055 RepID=A0A6P0UNX3_9FLAO|nr:HAD family hydrolase [Leptobacterium flavescens]NER14677.1 phosphoprotein phosphatase [Leptobacterium flavescens]